MKLQYLYNLGFNLKALIKSLFQKRIDWNYFASYSEDSQVDKHTNIHKAHYLKSVKVGYGTAIGPNARISYTTIGKFCSLGPNLLCGWGIHPIDGIATSPIFYSTLKQVGFTYSSSNKIEERKPIEIGNDVFIGANVTILDGVKISDGCVIGAGAVVSKDIPPYAVAVGSPIKIIKFRFSDEVIEKLLKLEWWNKDEAVHKDVEKNFFNVSDFLNKHC
ncbi:CatB-related O-acetyltransferase [Mucilaginibacter endophyticus]|uniref:CatB-related O-acetyltransferase n=1 Tax=Mucilaginibacter endophyticus TaxID=2675003 RepID=UPI000E0D2E20|nr:CatB-related O-acetyltransferase [Mucilaginibacter endophyticus]